MQGNSHVARAAAGAFVLAAVASAALISVAIISPDAIGALKAIGGKQEEAISVGGWLPVAVGIDFVLASAYGAGLALLAAALGARGPRGLAARAAIVAALAGATADFGENALVVAQAAELKPIIGLLAFLKYGTLSMSVLLIGSLLPATTVLNKFMAMVLRFVTPVSLALLVSGLGGDRLELAFPFMLVGTFLLLAWVARDLANVAEVSLENPRPAR